MNFKKFKLCKWNVSLYAVLVMHKISTKSHGWFLIKPEKPHLELILNPFGLFWQKASLKFFLKKSSCVTFHVRWHHNSMQKKIITFLPVKTLGKEAYIKTSKQANRKSGKPMNDISRGLYFMGPVNSDTLIFIFHYLHSIIPTHNMSCGTNKPNKISVIKVKYDIFKNTFFPSAKIEWNKLDWNIQKLENIEAFLKKIV